MLRILYLFLVLIVLVLSSGCNSQDLKKQSLETLFKQNLIKEPNTIRWGSKDISGKTSQLVYNELVQRINHSPEISRIARELSPKDIEMYRNKGELVEFIYDDPEYISINYNNKYITVYRVVKISFGIGNEIGDTIFLQHPSLDKNQEDGITELTVLFDRNFHEENKRISETVMKLLENK
ncbi:hypothetical protein L1765_00685 [Microaerobacter geothermalis]|uniref:hypothetical protein n=1 Tax=Microaerobacter geothermalis TaxID=674972 RepID=UPI001F39A67C|nr:hypothetical protein [Microaerobacter geothermalis]MCF6092507.1 hypothetical protein [Microaerobacter geothermalis]